MRPRVLLHWVASRCYNCVATQLWPSEATIATQYRHPHFIVCDRTWLNKAAFFNHILWIISNKGRVYCHLPARCHPSNVYAISEAKRKVGEYDAADSSILFFRDRFSRSSLIKYHNPWWLMIDYFSESLCPYTPYILLVRRWSPTSHKRIVNTCYSLGLTKSGWAKAGRYG